MNTELAAMIEAGRKTIEERQTDARIRLAQKIAIAAEERERHLAKLPAWMHEYAALTDGDYGRRIILTLPGCAPVFADSEEVQYGDDDFAKIEVAEPTSILYDEDEWYVGYIRWYCQSIEEAVALAAEHGESYWAMRAEADRRNAEGLHPEPEPEPTPDERIAAALERIAAVLEGFSDNGEANDALRVNVLR